MVAGHRGAWLGAAGAIAAALICLPGVGAHEPGMTGIVLNVHASEVTGEFQLPLKQLGDAVGLDLESHPSRVVPDHGPFLAGYVANNTAVSSAAGNWTIVWQNPVVRHIEGLDHIVFPTSFTPPAGLEPFRLRYDAIVEADTSHEVLVTVGYAGAEQVPAALFNQYQRQVEIDPADLPQHAFGAMVRFGFDHVREGADHLLFLLVLLLPAPLMAVGHVWQPAPGTTRPFWRLLHVVTSFTIGHSITLIASALGWVNLPSKPVEFLIAVSVAVGAVHAIRPLIRGGEPLIAGAFGLVHGLAFAGLLSGFNLGTSASMTSLLGFNIGVELAQLAAVALVFPSLWVLSRTRAYPRVRIGGGVLALVAATAWGLERLDVLDNPLAGAEEWIVGNPLVVAAALALAAGVAWFALDSPEAVAPGREEEQA